jgi:hypothetical protein
MKKFKPIFKEVRNTTYQKNLYDESKHNKIIKAPREFENSEEWIRILDASFFKELMPSVLHVQSDYLDEIATYIHKSAAEFRYGRFAEYRDTIVKVLEEEGLNPYKVLQKYDMSISDFNHFEIIAFFERELDINILGEDGEYTIEGVETKNLLAFGTDWSKYTKKELRLICKEYRIPQKGTVEEIIERMNESLEIFDL